MDSIIILLSTPWAQLTKTKGEVISERNHLKNGETPLLGCTKLAPTMARPHQDKIYFQRRTETLDRYQGIRPEIHERMGRDDFHFYCLLEGITS